MALAHIIGDPGPAEQLAQQLRDHGYEIEIFPPGTQSCSAADLEIILEQCSSEIVLSKAVAIAQDQNACLLVSSGVLPEALSGNQEDISDAESATEIPPDLPLGIQEEDPVQIADPTLGAPHQFGSQTPVNPQLAQDESTHEVLATFSNEETATQQVLDSTAATINFASNSVDHSLTNVPPISVFEELAQADEIGSCVRPSLTERDEVIEPLQESSPEDASDWPIWQIVVEEAAPSESFVAPLPLIQNAGNNTTVLRNARQLIRWTSDYLRMVADDRRFVRIAMATAAIAIAGLLFAATFHRFSPLPPRLTRGSDLALQPAPFQKVHADASSANRASDQSPVPTQAPAPPVQARSAKVLRASGQFTSDGAGLIAKDVVIRYGSRSASRHIFSDPIHPGVKYYSDLSPTTR
jgi:hypothetical protein